MTDKEITLPLGWFIGLVKKSRLAMDHIDSPEKLPYYLNGLAGYISSIDDTVALKELADQPVQEDK